MSAAKDKKEAKRATEQEALVSKLAQNFGRSVRSISHILLLTSFSHPFYAVLQENQISVTIPRGNSSLLSHSTLGTSGIRYLPLSSTNPTLLLL
mgnify:CR=1 FL=1